MSDDRLELLDQLHELARLELDLVVRDLDGEAAFQALLALRAEIRLILERLQHQRDQCRHRLTDLEEQLKAVWGRQDAAELLMSLAEARRELAELDAAGGPSQALHAELVRRTARTGDAA